MKRLLHYSLQFKNVGFSLLLVLSSLGLYQLLSLFPIYMDATQNASNTLSPSSINTLKQLHGKINITMYSHSKDAELGDIESIVRKIIAPYQLIKPDIKLNFVDPVKASESMRKIEISANREMVVEYAGRSEHLNLINEQSITNALVRLARTKDQKLMYVDGHGERKLDGIANHDLGNFGKKLKENGFKVSSLNLALAQDVPGNGNLLIITQPQIDLLPGEIAKLLRYIDSGGNLLWLLDAEPLHGLEQLSSKLGILLTPGIVTDPDAQKMNVPNHWTLGASYPPHPITRNFNLITAFPYARAIGREDSGREDRSGQADSVGRGKSIDWKRSTLIEAASNGWVSRTSTIPKKPHFDKNRDIPGPFSLAVALQRTINEREQRVVVVGSGAFLANAYSGNGGNIDLGINMVNWLTHEEHLITTQPRTTLDSSITLSKTQLSFISIGFVIVVPLLLIITGGVLWWRRRD